MPLFAPTVNAGFGRDPNQVTGPVRLDPAGVAIGLGKAVEEGIRIDSLNVHDAVLDRSRRLGSSRTIGE